MPRLQKPSFTACAFAKKLLHRLRVREKLLLK